MTFDIHQLVRDYGDPWQEAQRCRRDAALFDFSFIARARLRGAHAVALLESFQPRQVRDLAPGRICYALVLDAQRRVAADLTIWRIDADTFELMSGRRGDVAALCARDNNGVVEDLSEDSAVFAVQGPQSLARLTCLVDDPVRLGSMRYFGHGAFTLAGIPCRIGRLGYTGEKGFEIITTRCAGAALWPQLGRVVAPGGFAAIDCLRIEAGFMLFANECRIGPTITELGLSAFAPERSERDPRMSLTAFTARAAARPVLWQPPTPVLDLPGRGEIIISSACHSPLLDAVLGLGFVCSDAAGVRDPSGEFEEIELVASPFYDPHKAVPRGSWHR